MSTTALCPPFDDLSRAYSDGPSSALLSHVDGCTTCARLWQGLTDLDRASRAMPYEPPSTESVQRMRAAVLERALGSGVRKIRPLPSRGTRIGVALGLAAAAAAAAGTWIALTFGPRHDQSPPAEPSPPPAIAPEREPIRAAPPAEPVGTPSTAPALEPPPVEQRHEPPRRMLPPPKRDEAPPDIGKARPPNEIREAPAIVEKPEPPAPIEAPPQPSATAEPPAPLPDTSSGANPGAGDPERREVREDRRDEQREKRRERGTERREDRRERKQERRER